MCNNKDIIDINIPMFLVKFRVPFFCFYFVQLKNQQNKYLFDKKINFDNNFFL